MIKSINFKNFQPYLDETVDFCSGVNVVTGQSDAGKSAIVRGASWLFQNVPRGDSFHCNQATDGETSVNIEFDDGAVSRIKSSTRNDYIISSSDEPLTALRSGVPAEVLEITRMDELNIQKQHASYFLFQQTGGQVSTKINSIIGLEIMDKVLTTITQIVNETKKEVTDKKKEAKKEQEDLNKLAWIDAAETVIKEAEDLDASITSIEIHITDVQTLVQQARNLELERTACETFIGLEPIYSELIRKNEEHSRMEAYNIALRDDITRVRELQAEKLKCDKFMALEPIYMQLEVDNSYLVSLLSENESLRDAITKARKFKNDKDVYDIFLGIETSYDSLSHDYANWSRLDATNKSLREDFEKARALRKAVQSVRKIVRNCEPAIIELDAFNDQLIHIEAVVSDLAPMVATAKQNQDLLVQIQRQVDTLEAEYHTLLGENEECPICGQMIPKPAN